MGKFRKKPVVIEAIQWNGAGIDIREIPQWFSDAYVAGRIERNQVDRSKLIIETLEGSMTAMPDDWIIQGVKGELYPCKPDIFEATYEPGEE